MTGHTYGVLALKVLNNGDLASGSADGTIKIWNLDDGTIKKNLADNHGAYSFEVLQNGDLVGACGDCTIKIWE